MEDDLYDYVFHDNAKIFDNVNLCSGGSSFLSNNQAQDEFSMFLHQFMYRSPSKNTTSCVMADTGLYTLDNIPQPLITSQGFFTGDPVNMLSTGELLLGNVKVCGDNVLSLSAGVTENETVNEPDCESEEVIEALTHHASPKPPTVRGSKRTRAAEVHNLSEKRRRSRINEKMKALQNLIPNSNKTDKASMLDEAIEYLKQLQVQVQVLTLKNGFTLNPMAFPALVQHFQLSEVRMDFNRENGSPQMNTTGTLTLNQKTPSQNIISLPSHCSALNRLHVPNMSSMINSETSFGLDSSIVHTHFGPFHLSTSSGVTSGQDMLQHQQLNVNHSETNPSEFEIGSTSTALLPFNTQASAAKNSGSLEACMIGRDQTEGVHLKNMECNLILSPHLTGMQTGRNVHGDDIKLERKDF
ncbi:uncharacterized protein LOC116121982 isoform X2 [Pistacia vera]|uniref:uncharacterized protein LOC116121982 isoform X2 n=1 Tax=Pistacia vera TaxID=55513 RepID=UPI0012631A55|nr:uncharacterized protein LOC116121982 isoform X2 [Pistacia vera]